MFITTIRLLALQLNKNENSSPINLDIYYQDIETILYCLRDKINNNNIIKLLVLYLNLPKPFISTDKNLLELTLNTLTKI